MRRNCEGAMTAFEGLQIRLTVTIHKYVEKREPQHVCFPKGFGQYKAEFTELINECLDIDILFTIC